MGCIFPMQERGSSGLGVLGELGVAGVSTGKDALARRLGHHQVIAEHLKGPFFTEHEHTLQNTDVLSNYTHEFIWIIQVLEKPWQWASPLAGETTPGSVLRLQPLHKGPQKLIIDLRDGLVNLALDATFRASITA